jgi:hypothetical protein
MPKFFWDTVADRWKAQLEVVSKITAAAKKSKKYRRQKKVEWNALASIADELVERAARHHWCDIKMVGRLKDKTPVFRIFKSAALMFPAVVRGIGDNGVDRYTAFGWDFTLRMLQRSTTPLPSIILAPLPGDNISDMTRFSAGKERCNGWSFNEIYEIGDHSFRYAKACIDRFYLVIAHSEPFRFLPREIKELLFDYVFVEDMILLRKRFIWQ